MRKVAVINSNHNPYLFAPYRKTLALPRKELYSERMKVVVEMERAAGGGFVDLYGGRWRDWWSPFSMWLPYWRYRQGLMKVYRGFAPSKFETLSRYDFCLCFENMRMDGYISEKIIDCFYAGTIPVYLGAPDIRQIHPSQCFVDFSKFQAARTHTTISPRSQHGEAIDARGGQDISCKAMHSARFHDALIRELA